MARLATTGVRATVMGPSFNHGFTVGGRGTGS